MLRRTGLIITVLIALGSSMAVVPAEAADAPATVTEVQVTGPPSARFNLVVLGDGYTVGEQQKFFADVEKHVNTMWSLEPFKSYRSYFNVYAVSIVSPESGVDCDPSLSSPRRDTPLNMGFWGGCAAGSVQRLLTVDDAAAQRYANLVPGTSSANRQILALGNSSTYGGAGGTYATASGGNALSALISPHELGHSLGGLDDEYDYLQRSVPGGPYTGGEPSSLHHTLLTERQMRDQHAKWWRWLGEPSESGGTIGRYEGGLYHTTGVWRPSRHSMMKTLGYAFDQVSRERMTQRISGKVPILAGGTPSGVIGADRVVWVRVMHPVSHALEVSWTLDGVALPGHARALDLRTRHLSPGRHTLTAKVPDPTEFVRDPAVRASPALTAVRTWTVDTSVPTPPVQAPGILESTPTDHAVGATNVVYVETGEPTGSIPQVRWTLDGAVVPTPDNDRDFDLGSRHLANGTHTLSASVSGSTLTWTVDATGPTTTATVSPALLTIPTPGSPAYVFNGPFTMKLTASDDRPGRLISEFRVDGDGWHKYYGWPTDPDPPYLFTARGTDIDGLAYGNLGPDGLTVSPFTTRPPGYGHHTIEYRTTDAVGNTGPTGTFTVTLLPPG
ncbi:MAG TPA: M64 family metallopeptidase [Amycolatopsis sp.]|nr:M64 family metallopeptidase [Amycolatopsis sp.]